MASFDRTVVLDGINDFSIFGRDFSFDEGFNFIGRLRVLLDQADTGRAELVLRGDLGIDLLKFSGTPEIVIRDDQDADRRVNNIELPDGPATVDLPFTDVNDVRGFGTAGYDLSFGQPFDFIQLGGGDNRIDLDADFNGLFFGRGNNVVTFDGDNFGGSITGYTGEDAVNEITLGGGARMGSIRTSSGQETLAMQAGTFAERAQLGGNDDTVTIEQDARIDSLQPGSENNVLTLDGGQSNQTVAYRDDDVVRGSEGWVNMMTLGSGGRDVVTDFVLGEDLVALESVQNPRQVGFADVAGGVRLDYFGTSVLFEGLTVGQPAQVDNFEL